MMEDLIVSLLGIGIFALLGLKSSLALLALHRVQKNQGSPCYRVLRSPYAFVGKVPVVYFAVFFYAGVLGQLLQMFWNGTLVMEWIALGTVLAIVCSAYYAYILFFKLRLRCWGCIRIYFSNLMIGLFLISYYWNPLSH